MTDPFAEWPPEHYETPIEREERHMTNIASGTEPCPVCRYTSGHWPYCTASSVADWQNLPEPFASDLAHTRQARS